MKGGAGCCGFSPCENLKLCVKSRPPLVIFAVGIVMLTVAFVALTLYIQDQENIPNPNFVTDWDGFLLGVSRFHWTDSCKADDNALQSPDDFLTPNATQEVSVEVPVEVRKMDIVTGAQYRAVTVGKTLLHSETLPKRLSKSQLLLTFSDFNVSSDGRTGSACLTIASNDTFFSPKLKEPTYCTPKPATTDYVACETKEKEAYFSVAHTSDPLLKMYLTVDDKINIHVHLMSTTYFLFFVVLTMLVYSLLKRRAHATTSDSHAAHLHGSSNGVV